MPIVGNQEVIDCLERCIDLAREKDLRHVAVALAGYPDNGAVIFAGEIALAKVARETVEHLLRRMDETTASCAPPVRDAGLDASFHCYNVASGALGFDFLVWLIDAEMTRRRERARGPLKVGFWLGREIRGGQAEPKRRIWLDNVFRPALALIGAVEDERAVRGRQVENFTMKTIALAAKRGEAVPRFSSPHAGRYEPGMVTITLREATHWPHRNSNLGAWLRLASDLRAAGERVVFIRDTERAFEPLGNFETDPLASVDLVHRMARYETAKANLFIGNGPATLGVFSDKPWLQFVALEDDDSGYLPNTAKFWRDNHGIEPGGQYPWSRPDQRLVWAPDSYEQILTAFSGNSSQKESGKQR